MAGRVGFSKWDISSSSVASLSGEAGLNSMIFLKLLTD